jgi:hypothetical protein
MAQKRKPTKTRTAADAKLRQFTSRITSTVQSLARRVEQNTQVHGNTALAPAPRAAQGITAAQRDVLSADPTNSELAILPTGELYIPHLHVRRRLNRAFGAGCYVIRECSPVSRQGAQVIQTWAIDIDGLGERARATGGAEYQERNRRTTWDDAIEAAKSIAISRCGKAMGIGIILSDKGFQRAWRAKHCGIARVLGRDRGGHPKESYQWRRLDDEPFDNEQEFVDPNKDAEKAAAWARKVRRVWNDDTTDDDPGQRQARPPQSRSGATPPGSGPKPAGHGSTPAAVQDGEVVSGPPATTSPFAPPADSRTPQVFVRCEFVKEDSIPGRKGTYKLWRCETVYAIGDGRTARAEYGIFDADFPPKIDRLITKQQPCELEWRESTKHNGQYWLVGFEVLTSDPI